MSITKTCTGCVRTLRTSDPDVCEQCDLHADEQSERIAEGVADFLANPEDYSYEDLEDLFEDRDPAEFL